MVAKCSVVRRESWTPDLLQGLKVRGNFLYLHDLGFWLGLHQRQVRGGRGREPQLHSFQQVSLPEAVFGTPVLPPPPPGGASCDSPSADGNYFGRTSSNLHFPAFDAWQLNCVSQSLQAWPSLAAHRGEPTPQTQPGQRQPSLENHCVSLPPPLFLQSLNGESFLVNFFSISDCGGCSPGCSVLNSVSPNEAVVWGQAHELPAR